MKSVKFDKYFMQNKGHGNNLIIKAGVRKGKTTLVSLIVKILLDKTNFIIVSNVRFENSVYEKYLGRIFYINSLTQYLEYISKFDYKHPILLVLDDAQSKDSMTSKGVMSKEGKKLSSFLIFIGKLQTSLIYIAHTSYIPRSLIEGFEPLYIYKTSRTNFIISPNFHEVDSKALSDKESIIVNMPSFKEFDKYYLPFMSLAFTDFRFDVDLDLLYNELTQYEIGEKTKECIEKFLIENKESTEIKELKELQSLSYEKLYMAFCLKKGKILSSGETFRDLINPNIIQTGRKKLKEIGLK